MTNQPPPRRPAASKGLFVDEIAAALSAGDIDVAVHSAKGLPAFEAPDTIVGAVKLHGHSLGWLGPDFSHAALTWIS